MTNEEEEGEALVPPKTKIDSNDVSNTHIKIGYTQQSDIKPNNTIDIQNVST